MFDDGTLNHSNVTTLLIATRNNHKIGEIRSILGEAFRYLTLENLPTAPEVVEDANSFAGNAAKKATDLALWLASENLMSAAHDEYFVLADDSGLEVDALGGAPGVHSARFAALDSGTLGNSKDADNNAKLLRLLKDAPAEKRTARFRCVIALVSANPQSATANPQIFAGACEGRINFAPRGAGGFGYDPLFIPDGFKESFAELGEDVKNRLSHRAAALEKLKDYFRNNPSA